MLTRSWLLLLSEVYMSTLPFPQNSQSTVLCPCCNKPSVVLHGDSTYVCLNPQCNFRNDVSTPAKDNMSNPLGPIVAVVIAIIVATLLSSASKTPDSVQDRDAFSRQVVSESFQ